MPEVADQKKTQPGFTNISKEKEKEKEPKNLNRDNYNDIKWLTGC